MIDLIQQIKRIACELEFAQKVRSRLNGVRFTHETDEETFQRVMETYVETICHHCRGSGWNPFTTGACRYCRGSKKGAAEHADEVPHGQLCALDATPAPDPAYSEYVAAKLAGELDAPPLIPGEYRALPVAEGAPRPEGTLVECGTPTYHEGKLDRMGYQQIIDGDIAWLRAQPRTLERDHVIMIVEASPGHEYPDAPTPPTTQSRVGRWCEDGEHWHCHCGAGNTVDLCPKDRLHCVYCSTSRPPLPEVPHG